MTGLNAILNRLVNRQNDKLGQGKRLGLKRFYTKSLVE